MEKNEVNLNLTSDDVIDFSGENYDMSVFSAVVEEPEEVEEAEGGTTQNIENTNPISDLAEGETVANEDKSADEGEGSSSSPGIYSSFANVLTEQGILSSPDPDTKIETADDLIEALSKEIETREYSDLNETQRKYLEGLRNGIPEHKVQEHIEITNELSSITAEMLEAEDNQELRKALIIEDFKRKGFTDQKAANLAQRSIDIGVDLEDAKESLGNLLKDEEQRFQAQIQAEQQRKVQEEQRFKKSLEDLKKEIEATTEVIPGFKINKVNKDKLYELITKPAAKLDNGTPISAIQKARMENPVSFEIKLNYLFQLTDGFKDFSKITAKVKSKAVSELDQVLKGQQFASPGNSGYVQSDLLNQGGSAFTADQLGEIADF